MNQNKAISIQFEAPLSGRLDAIVSQQTQEYSRGQIQSWIKNSSITVNSTCITKPSYKVIAGDQINIDATLEIKLYNKPQDIPIDIIYEDECILVINKPKNQVVHPGAGNQDNTLMNALLHHLPTSDTLPRAGIVHRLDKDTSGLMVIAKTTQSYHFLVDALKEHAVTRTYVAICCGMIIQSQIIDQPIGRDANHRLKMSIREDGKSAITHLKILERYKHFSYLKLQLETGRTHQIRVHLKSIGHPILGDLTYGRKRLIKDSPELNALIQNQNTQLLHASELSFVHPTSKEPMNFVSPTHSEITHVLSTLEKFDQIST